MTSASNKAPDLSVVIPTCGRPEMLRHCLDKLAPDQQGLELYRSSPSAPNDPPCCEVIVSDDGHDEATREMLSSRYPWVKHVEGPARGPAANRNNGVRFATGEWIVFCDDDCLPDPGLIDSYAKAQTTYPDCEVFEGRTTADREKRHPLEESPINSKGGNLWSCNFAIRRKLFKDMGGFDERFKYAAGEDFELRVRIEKAGIHITFIPEAVVVHPWRRLSIAGYLKQQFRHRHANLVMIALHPEYRSYFSTWNLIKEVIRYYGKWFCRDFRTFGISALLYQPLYLWCQFRRIMSINLALFHTQNILDKL